MIFMIFFALVANLEAFKILVLNPYPSFSHQRPILALTERLVAEGHELFVVSPNVVPGLEKHSNYTYADLSFGYRYKDDEKGTKLYQRIVSKWDLPSILPGAINIVKQELQSEAFLQFKQLIHAEKIKFDVVIAQSILLPFLTPLAKELAGNAPIIAFSSFLMDLLTEDIVGNTAQLSFVPSPFGHFTNKMSLWQKIENWFSHLYVVSKIRGVIEASAREHYRETYGQTGESVVDGCWANISLTLITSNALYYYPRLLGPNIVEVGPLHLQSLKDLPKNLQDWLDGAEKGVIYFSFGSSVKTKSLAEDVIQHFLTFFRELPAGYRVLWKWEHDAGIPGQSDNILTQKWMPQASVLAHPKTKLFITQGGLQSFQEAVHYGVPTVSIPWVLDQECVTAKMVDAKVGIKLSPQDVHSFASIKSAVETVLYDESYSRNMRELSTKSHDFTAQAMDKAVFWVEHVARHGGASHLRPSSADASLFEYFCLDVILVILSSFLASLYGIYFIFKAVI